MNSHQHYKLLKLSVTILLGFNRLNQNEYIFSNLKIFHSLSNHSHSHSLSNYEITKFLKFQQIVLSFLFQIIFLTF